MHYLQEENFKLQSVFHNPSTFLKHKAEEATIEHFKDLVFQIIEKPMFLNSELIANQNVLADSTAFVHILFKQKGIFEM